jgi:hypothetical protein
MTAVRLYRDDGPLAEWVGGKLGAGATRRDEARRLDWLVPPLLRLVEYGWLIGLTTVVDRDALPVCFAFVGVLAFHHYDAAYRVRYRGSAPPGWVRLWGGGWDGRMLLASLLALAGVLGPALLVGAVGLGLAWGAESVSTWVRGVNGDLPAPVDDGEVLE